MCFYSLNYNDIKEMGGQPSVHYQKPGKSEPIKSCDRFCCYRKCRMSMIGGGRCTSSGCICYESFFIENQENNMTFGAPVSIEQPEDKIWYFLNYTQTEQIQEAMRHYANHPDQPNYMCEKE